MYCSLLYQLNSVLQIHILSRLFQTPILFSMQPSKANATDLYLTNIVLSEEKNIIDVIQELPPFKQQGQMAYHHLYW